MANLSPDEAREFVRLVLVAEVESRDSGLAWTTARRLAEEHGMPCPLDVDARSQLDTPWEANAFYER